MLKEFWEKLVELRRAANSLRPEIDYAIALEQVEKERRLEKSHQAIVGFLNVVDKNRPFYPHEIYVESIKLMHVANKEKIEYRNRNPENDPEYWESANKHAEEIKNTVDNLLQLIRDRVTSYE